MTIALAAVGAALVTLVVTLVVQWLVHRKRAGSDERLTEVVRELEARMDGMVRDLTTTIEQSQVEGKRTRMLGELAGSIDLDEVLTRVLEAAGAIDGVDAALVTLAPQAGGQPIVATLGLSAEEAERQAVLAPPDGREARAISMSYEYGADQDSPDSEAIRSGVAVPLPGETAQLGLLTIFTRSTDQVFTEEQVSELEELALRAGPAIENARRFREARQLADLDALTGLHNRRFFHETLAREVARAHRYDRNLGLIIFDLDDFKGINDRIGHLSGDGVLAEAAERIRDVVRSADIACRVGGDEFAVILPESTLSDADQLYGRLRSALSSRPVGQAGPLTMSAGMAELQPDDDAIAFFQRADHALYGAKEAGKGQVVAASLMQPQPPSNMPPGLTPVPPPEEPPSSQAG
ncbi:MAG TPA: sensor domain-containing diguanylate cyclase [Gaiellaceae bacterium]|jgi:diguanylate cyclase (GGDEF)-like protein